MEWKFEVKCTRYVRSVGKHIKVRVNVRLDDSVGLGVIIGVDNVVRICIGGEVMI